MRCEKHFIKSELSDTNITTLPTTTETTQIPVLWWVPGIYDLNQQKRPKISYVYEKSFCLGLNQMAPSRRESFFPATHPTLIQSVLFRWLLTSPAHLFSSRYRTHIVRSQSNAIFSVFVDCWYRIWYNNIWENILYAIFVPSFLALWP